MKGQPLKILPKPCSNALGEQGTCMFVWECIKTEGKHLGTCVDGFLFGSCCSHNETLNQLDYGSSTPVKPYYSNSIASAAYHSDHEYTTTNLDLISNPTSNLTSYVNFNNNPPNDNDVYHIHHESNTPIQSMYSTISSINLSFLPSSNSQSSTSSLSNTNYHHSSSNLNNNNHHFHNQHNHHHLQNGFNSKPNNLINNNLDNDDHRRPHTHNNHSNHTGTHYHHHNYENFLHTTNTGDKSNQPQLTTAKPSMHSYINFNLTNHNHHLISSSSKLPSTNNQLQSQYTTTILPSIVMNYNPFKPANHSFLINKNNSTTSNLNGVINKLNITSPSSNNNLVRPPAQSSWNSFYKPWSNKPSNG